MSKYKSFPLIGQLLFASFYTEGLVPIEVFGRCANVKWANENTIVTIVNRWARHEIFYFSPLVIIVQMPPALSEQEVSRIIRQIRKKQLEAKDHWVVIKHHNVFN